MRGLDKETERNNNMKKKQMFSLALIMLTLFVLCGCGTKQEMSISSSGDSVTVNDLALRPDGEAGKLYENDGLKLMIPLEYDELLITETPKDDGDARLFSVSEKASIEAARAASTDYEGAGWLFSIERIDEAALQDLLCNTDLSGTEVFARDAQGRYYLYCHPTDVRYVRENNEAMAADQETWTALNGWAWKSVRETFLRENPELIADTRGSTSLELSLAQIAYKSGTRYSVSTTEYGPIEPAADTFDAAPWLEKLMTNVHYELIDLSGAPDGEYVVLSLPDEELRFDFFLAEGKENLIREVHGEEEIALYQASFADDSRASAVMLGWYDALVADHDMSELGYTPDSLLGNWVEKIAGRGTIAISKNAEGQYEVQVNLASSPSEMNVWTMTAHPAASNMLRYENCRYIILTLSEDGPETEKLQYENGTGLLTLLSTNELQWQDNTGHAADDVLFVFED